MRRVPLLFGAFAINVAIAAGFGVMTNTPAGGPDVVDLQLAMSPGVFKQIVDLWGPQTVADVRRSIWLLDFLFPIAYAFLISRLYRSLCETGGVKPYRLVVLAPWIAAAADYAENVLLLQMLGGPQPPAAMAKAMSSFAIVKFVLLAIAAGFTLSALLKSDRGRVIRSARYSVISLLIGTLPILMLDQGRDLLLGLADPSGGRHQIFFVAWSVVWAFSVWYWSRVILDADAGARPSKLYQDWATWLPRIAGFLTLFVPGVACLLVASTAGASRGRLMALGVWCVALAIVFGAYVIFRRRIRGLGGRTAHGYSVRAVAKQSLTVFALSALASLVMLCWLTFFSLQAGHMLGAVAILAVVAANTVFLGGLAVFLTRAYRIPIEIAALTCAAIFSVWNDNHDVRFVDLPVARDTAPDLSAVFSSWIARAPGDPGKPIPVIVAAAEGGGIRAAYWTSLVLHHLADLPDAGVMFPQRLFAISSVSGGSFGAAVYAGLRRDPTGTPRAAIASAILQERFLAPMVAKLVSGDLLQWFLPMPVRAFDRSSAMETGFAAAYNEHVHHDSMIEKFTEFRPLDRDDVPVMLLNSTSVQLGRRVVASPYRWPLSDVSVEEQDPIDFHALTGRDVSVATAVHNTARFPYISAAGHLRAKNGENLGHLVDGGYFENTGADTLIDLLRYLKQAASPLSVRFIVVAMLNTPPELHLNDPSRIPWRETASLGELFSPLRALLQTRTARGDLALRRLRESVEPGDVVEFRICGDSGLREAPLGWQLSQEMVDVLDANLSQQCFLEQLRKLKEAIRR